MRKGRKKLNQAGMSLVELIVVILIIGILSAGSGIGMVYVSRMNASSAAEKLVSTLEKTRLLTISSSETVKMELIYEDNNYYARILQGGVETEREKLGNGGLTITVRDSGGGSTTVDTTTCEFSYKKSNGAFETSCLYTRVEIEGSKSNAVCLVRATGRCYVE